jgi:tetraacyldisaccharide 4'-kinase
LRLAPWLLEPFSWVYETVVRLRARAYRNGILRRRKLEGVVISVGNLTTGGTGKTPMVLWIAERLVAEGKKAGILTRGYRGRTHASGRTSDEVRLLESRLGDRVALGVGADRYGQGVALAKRGVAWFVLDDGFQHQKLERDVDILLIDASNPFGGGRLLPAGRLREPKSALARADIIVITRSKHAPELEAAVGRACADLGQRVPPIFYAHAEFDGIIARPALPERGEPDPLIAPVAAARFFLFCGIGNPSAFLADAQHESGKIMGHKYFPDHHRYTTRDLREIEKRALAADATALLCTEKDVFNLSPGPWGSLGICFLPMTLGIDREGQFWSMVLEIAERRSRSAPLIGER